jgi:outer membrane protein assembly factor BamA
MAVRFLFYRSQELSATLGLTFPRLFLLRRLNKNFIDYNPRTRFSGSYNLVFRPEYRRTSTRLSMTYFLNKGQEHQYAFSLIDFNYLQTPFLEKNFSTYLNDLFFQSGNNLIRSFEPAINTNINGGYTFNTYRYGENKNSSFIRIYVENGGSVFNMLSPKLQSDFKEWARVRSLFVYWKFNIDYRKYIPVSKKSSIASRLNLGLANPYAGDKALPYEKYFFSGGSNSVRAWLPRRLGVGAFALYNSDGSINYNFEQPGLVLIEASQELRFKIAGIFDGAIFYDAGNVWLLNDPDKRKNIDFNFINEMALGVGYGLRLDFSFLIVRLDAAYKTYNPARKGNKWEITDTNFLKINDIITKATWNIAVGYPF